MVYMSYFITVLKFTIETNLKIKFLSSIIFIGITVFIMDRLELNISLPSL